MTNSTQQQLSIGSVNFTKFEVPEHLPNLFGQQKISVHDFPGGTRTLQQLGSFPFPDISWTGVFFQGDAISSGTTSTPIQRASLLNSYRVTGEVVILVWGPFQYDVVVHEFEIIGRLEQFLEYRIKVIPIVDYTTTSNIPAAMPDAATAQFNAQTGVTAAVTSTTGLLLPPLIIAAATAILQTISALQISSANQGITPENQAVIQAQIASLQATLAPIINGTDYGQATAASVLSANLFALSTTLSGTTTTPVATIVVTNPNLPQLASQYYGDADLWVLIAQANNLTDILPLGTFTLTIPASTTPSALLPTS